MQDCPNCHGGRKAFTARCWMCNGTAVVSACLYCDEKRDPARMADHRCFPMVAAMTTDPPAHFRQLCQMHDTSYQFSDDGGVWQRGNAEYATLQLYARRHLAPTQARDIWNEVVRHKFPSPEGQYPFILKEWRA